MVNIEEYIMMQSPVPKPYYTYASAGDGIFFKAPVNDIPEVKVESVWDWVLTIDKWKIQYLKKNARPYIVNGNTDDAVPRLIIDCDADPNIRKIKLSPLAVQSLEMYESGKIPMPTIDDINRLNNEWLYYYKDRNNPLKGLTIKDTARGFQLVPVVPEEPKKKQKKFYIGQQYKLKLNNLDGTPAVEYCFECKKFINEIAGTEVNVLIMKRLGIYQYKNDEKVLIENPESLIYTLNKYDCKRYHIKYEPGLEVWPMTMQWITSDTENDNNN